MKEKGTLFDSLQFREEYHYDGPLGAFRSPEGTDFYLWAPTADSVQLRLYPDGSESKALGTFSLSKGDRGLYSIHFDEDLDGIYYDYAVCTEGVTFDSADPYAVACGINGQRSMVLDLDRTDPEGWNEDRAPQVPDENVIYEIHVRDFSDSESSGVRKEWRGKYMALTEHGTTLHGDGIHPTGLDYLQDLGVTYIQLMPSFDYGSVDEKKPSANFNWGYDPVNYNVPEGAYSTDPWHGEVRIREMKQAIQALHAAGFRVIMDVVYNHTYYLDSWLFRTVPWYYYRENKEGIPSNGSGCGNDIATERSMCSRYILDSVLYWTKEYHIDGFRFDLMGLLDVPLMNSIRKALDEAYGRGQKILFGEPWSAAGTEAIPGTMLAAKDHMTSLDREIGAFCDATRDAIKGSIMDVKARGIANGGPVSAELLQSCFEGWIRPGQAFSVRTPSQTISYISSHDDWTLWDKLVYTMDEDRNFAALDEKIIRRNMLAAALLFACRGNLFMLSGEEFGRTKMGIKNSFDSSIEINRLDWDRAWKNREMVDYYRGLIALRKKIPALTGKDAFGKDGQIDVTKISDRCYMAKLADTDAKEIWPKLILYVNAGEEPEEVLLPESANGWQPLFDGVNSFLWNEKLSAAEGRVTIAPLSVASWGWIS